MLEAAAGALRRGWVASAADGITLRQTVGAEPGAKVAAAAVAIDVATAGGATEADAGLGRVLGADHVDAAPALVVARRGVTQRAAWQTDRSVVAQVSRAAVVQDDARGSCVVLCADAGVARAVDDTKARAWTLTIDSGRSAGQAGGAGAAVTVVAAGRAEQARIGTRVGERFISGANTKVIPGPVVQTNLMPGASLRARAGDRLPADASGPSAFTLPAAAGNESWC